MSKELISGFKKCKNDEERWMWAIENKDNGITVYLDNDDTFITIDGDDTYQGVLRFDSWLGWSSGIFDLMEVLGINAESV